MYIVGFNGPPRSGKDTLARMLAEHMDFRVTLPVREVSLSMPLRRIAYAMVGFTGALDGPDYEAFKVLKYPQFGYATGRQLMIDVSESFLKQKYGKEIMAEMLLVDNADMENGILLIRDSGFQCEVDPLIRAVGADNLTIVRVFRSGTSFADDSREWVEQPLGRTWEIHNSYSLDDLRIEAGRLYGRLVNQMGWKL